MLDHHDLLRTQTRWQESSAGKAVSGDSIPINGNLIPAPNDGKAGCFHPGLKSNWRRPQSAAQTTG